MDNLKIINFACFQSVMKYVIIWREN